MPKRVLDLDLLAGVEEDISLYLIPGVGSRPPSDWAFSSADWISFLKRFPDKVRVYGIQHGLDLENFSWQALREVAVEILEELFERSNTSAKVRPLIFLAHSLGAALLKQVLSIANIQSDKYQSLLQKTAGIIFIGGPHDLANTQELKEKVLDISRCFAKKSLSKEAAANIREEVVELRDISSRYTNINLRVDTLSVFETVGTTLRYGRLGITKQKRTIADRPLVTLYTYQEQFVGLPHSHRDLCDLLDATQKPSSEVTQWLQHVIEHAVSNVQKRIRHITEDVLPNSVELASVTSLDIGRHVPHELFDRMTVEDDTLEALHGSIGNDRELAPLISGLHQVQREATLPCFMMDTYTQNHDFFGREELLKRLDEDLLPDRDRLYSSQPQEYRHCVLCGMAGLGKTETAIQYAYTRRTQFDAIFWVRAEDDNKLEADFAQIAARLGLEDPDEPAPPVVARELAKGWLANPVKFTSDGKTKTQTLASWLVIFDNADDPNTLIDYMEVTGSGSLLITSRNPLAQSTFSPNSALINIAPFDEEEAVRFLHRMTRNKGEPEAATRIVQHFDGLPLAMVQMAGIIRQQYLTYNEFLEQYIETESPDSPQDLYATEAQPLRQTARGNLSSIWAIDSLDKDARAVLEVLSMLDPDCVQETIFTEAFKNDNVAFAGHFPTTKQGFTSARRQLQQSSLIRRNDARSEFWLHRVLQDTVKSKMTKERMEEIFSSSIWLMLQAWPSSTLLDTHNVSRWKTCEALFPHILTLERMYSKVFKDIDLAASDNLARLLSSATWWKHERGESHAILQLCQVALQVSSKSTASDMPTLQYDIHYTLASVGDETNNADLCLKHSRIVLDMELKRGNTADVRLAQAHNQVGIAYMISKDYGKARDAFLTSLECWPKVDGFHKGLLSIATANLGLAYWHLGELKQGEVVLEQGIKDREEQYGPMDHHSFRLGRLFHALGDIQESMGDLEKAESSFRKAFSSHVATIGPSHHRTADVCHKVAQHCLRKGQLAEALVLVDQALKVWSVDKRTYKPEITRTTFLKGKILEKQGKATEAEQMIRLAVRQRRTLAKDNQGSKAESDLEEADFDDFVAFWSK